MAKRLKQLGLLVGVLGGALAIPHDMHDVYLLFWSRPKTQVYPGADLTLTYNGLAGIVKFEFNTLIQNSGTSDDLFTDMTGSISNEAVPVELLPLAHTDFLCTSNNMDVRTPLTVKKDVPLPLSCSVSSLLPKLSDKPFENAGTFRVEIAFKNQNNVRHQMAFCFWLSAKDIAELFPSATSTRRRFLYPQCK